MQLAELNIALLRAPIDDPMIAEFANALDEINTLAEASPGFVWRLTGDGNDATSLRPFPDPEMIVNLSVWTDRPSLHDYVYKTAHTPFLRKRAAWFHRIEVPSVVLWWVEDGTEPTVEEAKARYDHLRAHGATPYAFGWRDEFDPVVLASPSSVTEGPPSTILATTESTA
jgi:Domain of unknown function (DUF3291)